MYQALMLWDIPKTYPNSMDRYAEELSSSLRAAAPPGWSFFNMVPKDILALRKLNNNLNIMAKIDDYLSRFVVYPFKTLSGKAEIYHIVDQGYGHLTYTLPKNRVIVTCHDLMTLRGNSIAIPGFAPSRSSIRKFRWVVNGLKRARAIITVSSISKNDIMEFLGIPERKIYVIPNGISRNFQKIKNPKEIHDLKIRLGLVNDQKLIIHVSSNQPYKNLEGVIKTLSFLVRDFGLEICLLRVGDPLTTKQWQLARSLKVDNCICEAGNLTDQELVLAYNLANVMLFPSWWEGFGLPPLEAMACGTPVVVSNRGALPEVVGDAAVVTEPDDHRSMAIAIKRILVNAEWRESLLERGLSQAARFRWENVAAQTLKVYEKVLASAT